MSLFEDPLYRWRETYFVLFRLPDRPEAAATEQLIRRLGERYDVSDVRLDDQGRLESMTLLAPEDFAAMDISFVAGEDVTAQVQELLDDLKRMKMTPEDPRKLEQIKASNARYEIYHFEQLTSAGDEDEYLDPGTLFVVMELLAGACSGVGIDPQSGTVI